MTHHDLIPSVKDLTARTDSPRSHIIVFAFAFAFAIAFAFAFTKHSQNTCKKTLWQIETGGVKDAIQERTQPQNTQETHTRARDDH